MVDIVSHAGIGLVLAAPLAAEHPFAALAVAFGSVAPDLDTFSRCAGKRAFLRMHQTGSHALATIAVVSLALGGIASWYGLPGLELGLGAWVGMTVHSLLDLTNTYGITLWTPWSRRRCLEWLFFIDAGFIGLLAAALVWIGVLRAHGADPGWLPTLIWLGSSVAWIAWRSRLRARAAALAPAGTVALIPSAWNPWKFYGTAHADGNATTFTLDARSGTITANAHHRCHDAALAPLLAQVPEVAVMRSLSPAYHALTVEPGDGGTVQRIACRDLRIRNFTDRFGACDIICRDGLVVRVDLNV